MPGLQKKKIECSWKFKHIHTQEKYNHKIEAPTVDLFNYVNFTFSKVIN